jgi:hypothetical protein
MRKFKRVIHKQFGGVGNFFAMLILVALTVIFINTFVLTKRDRKLFVSSKNLPLKNIILASNDFADELPRRIEVINNQNRTTKPVKEDPADPQRIARPSTPDAGR